MKTSWDTAFLLQARSDFAVFRSLGHLGHEFCHRLHYLQMASEKLAKAALCRSSGGALAPQPTHRTFVRLLRLLARTPAAQDVLGLDARRLQAFTTGLLPVALEIEQLAPTAAIERPNPEYPWQSPGGEVRVPCQHTLSLESRLRDGNGLKLLKLVGRLLEHFDRLF